MVINDIGVPITATILDKDGTAKDISSATTKTLIARKPDNTNVTWTASFVTDGTDGKIRYTTQSGDIDQKGMWFLQANLVGSGFNYKSGKGSFFVKEAIS